MLLLLALLLPHAAPAKSNSWWDCYYREFELCQGRSRDPDAPAEAGGANAKAYCDGSARKTCDEEDNAKTYKLEGRSANEIRGKGALGVAPANTSPTPVNPVSDIAVAAGAAAEPEGRAPSGDETVLGVRVTASIGDTADHLDGRNLRGCAAIDGAYARRLCCDAPGAKGGNPVTLEYYRGKLSRLVYERGASSDSLRGAIAEAEQRTRGHAAIAEENGACVARLPLGGGTLTLTGTPIGAEPCGQASLEAAALAEVEWVPSRSARATLEAQRAADEQGRLPASEVKR